ncbi:MAG: periplasmic heavy metal sensor [Pseudomonadota bacterium]
MQDSEAIKPYAPRWMKILLGVSLAVNLAIAGVVVGVLLRPDGPGERFSRSPGLGAFGAPYMMALTKEDRRAVLGALRNSSKGEVPSRRARREIFDRVLTTLRATPFDASALENVISNQAAVSVTVQRRTQEAWLDVVARMDDAERARYADAVEVYLKRGRKRR